MNSHLQFHRFMLAFGLLSIACVSSASRAAESARCVPNPTLLCVLDAAVEAVETAGALAGPETLAKIALVQKRIGDLEAYQRTVALAIKRRGEIIQALKKAEPGRKYEISDQLLDEQLIWFLVKVGAPQALAIAERELSLANPEAMGIARLVETLVLAGLADDARALVRRQSEWYAAAAEKLDASTNLRSDRAAYSYDILLAYIHLGERQASERWAAESWQHVRRRTIVGYEEDSDFRGKVNVREWLALARTLIAAKLTRPTDAILAESRALLGQQPAPGSTLSDEQWRRFDYHANLLRLELALSHLEQDVAKIATALRAMRDLRMLLGIDFTPGHLIDDLNGMLAAEVDPLPVGLDQEASAIFQALKSGPDPSNIEYSRVARIFALLGDEHQTDAALASMSKGKSVWEIPNLTADVCLELVKGRHFEASLRCAARLTKLGQQHQANTAAVYAVIAEALAKK